MNHNKIIIQNKNDFPEFESIRNTLLDAGEKIASEKNDRRIKTAPAPRPHSTLSFHIQADYQAVLPDRRPYCIRHRVPA